MGEAGFARESPLLGMDLLFAEAPQIDIDAIMRRLAPTLPRSVKGGETGARAPGFQIVHLGHVFQMEDAEGPAITVVGQPMGMRPMAEIEAAHQQTWGWDGARDTVARCAARVSVIELMGRPMQPHIRLDLLVTVVAALVDELQPLAIHSVHAQRILQPADVASMRDLACLNVRLFNVADEGDCVMDTLGLATLNLPDLQTRFHKSGDPTRIAVHLYNLATHLIERGDVLRTGDTVEGPDQRGLWRCQHEAAWVAPDRDAVTLEHVERQQKKSLLSRLWPGR